MSLTIARTFEAVMRRRYELLGFLKGFERRGRPWTDDESAELAELDAIWFAIARRNLRLAHLRMKRMRRRWRG